MKKRVLSFALAVAMLCAMLPVNALAADPEVPPESSETQATTEPAEEPAPDAAPEDVPAVIAEPAPAGDPTPTAELPDGEPSGDAAEEETGGPEEEVETYTLPETVTGSFREKGTPFFQPGTTQAYDTTDNMWITMPADHRQKDLRGYTFTVKGPGPEGAVQTVEAKSAGSENKYALWSGFKPTDAGTYTVTVEKDGQAIATSSIDIIKVTFHTGEGGHFGGSDDEKEEVHYYSRPTSSYSVYYFMADISKVTASEPGVDFVGWATVASQSGYNELLKNGDLFNLPGIKEKNTAFKLYANYGKVKTYTYEVKDDNERKIELGFGSESGLGSINEPIYMGTMPSMAEPAGYAKVFTIHVTGNTSIKVSVTSVLDFADVSYQYTGQDLAPNQSYTFTVTPKKGLSKGYYKGQIKLERDRTMSFFYVSLDVETTSLKLTLPDGQSKFYGQTVSDEQKQNILKGSTLTYLDGKTPSFKADEIGLTLDCNGFAANADAGGDYGYSVRSSPDYNITLAEPTPKFTVKKVTPAYNVTASGVTTGSPLSRSTLSGTFTNPYDPSMSVTGTLEWTDGQDAAVSNTPGIFKKTWKFTPTGNDAKNYEPITGQQVDIIVSERTPTSLHVEGETAFTYDGRSHTLAIKSDRPDGMDTALTVKYKPAGADEAQYSENAPTDAGTYDVYATMMENVDYAHTAATFQMTISPRTVDFRLQHVLGKVYDGTDAVDPGNVNYKITNLVGSDAVEVTVSAKYDSEEVGSRNVAVEMIGLTGSNSSNYCLPDKRTVHTTAMINPAGLTITPTDSITKAYGAVRAVTASDFTVKCDTVNDPDTSVLEFDSGGEPAEAKAGTYPITVTLHSKNYKLSRADLGSMTVTKATPVPKGGGVSVTPGRYGCELDHVALSGTFINPNNESMVVDGSLTWANAGTKLPLEDDDGIYEAEWHFQPKDLQNYNVPKNGSVSISLLDREPLHITVNGNSTQYNGGPQGIDVTVDANALSYEILYKKHTELAAAAIALRLRVLAAADDDWSDWTAAKPTDAGTYDVKINAFADSEDDEHVDSSLTTLFTITPADPHVAESVKTMTVDEGTPVSSVTLTGFTGINGEALDGELIWADPNGIVDIEGEEFHWTFCPYDRNYSNVSGMTVFKLKVDPRVLRAEVYNLPAEKNYGDYAMVDIACAAGGNLKLGDTVTFYADAACTAPVSEAVAVTEGDINANRLTVPLNGSALSAGGGSVWARITSSQHNAPVEFKYGPEPGFTLAGVDGRQPLTDLHLVGGDSAAVLIRPAYAGDGVTLNWFLSNNADGKVSILNALSNDARQVVLRAAGDAPGAVLTVTMTFPLTDPLHIGKNTDFTFTRTVTLYTDGPFKGTVSGVCKPEGLPSASAVFGGVTATANQEQDDLKELNNNGKIDYNLTVKGQEMTDADDGDVYKIESFIADHAAELPGYGEGSDLLIQYLDINLTKTVYDKDGKIVNGNQLTGGEYEGKESVPEPGHTIRITVGIPQDMLDKAKAEGMAFSVIRVHHPEEGGDPQVALLRDLDSDPDTVTFDTDRFSTYAIVAHEPLPAPPPASTGSEHRGEPTSEADEEEEDEVAAIRPVVTVPQTGDESDPALWLALFITSALGLGVLGILYAKRRRGTK